jgi:uncharacterized protein (DUF2132 family)
MSSQPNNPLHGVTLQNILEHLVEKIGWEEMGEEVNIKCFKNEPSIKSSLKFLRRTPWARKEVEELYLEVKKGRKKKQPKKAFKKIKPSKKREEQEDDGLDW